MATVRRWYILIINAVSLQSTAWATIALLRGLLTGLDRPVTATAFQIAVIVVGLPLWLFHWVWARRLAAESSEERGSAMRRFYLYGTLAGFLGPILANAFDLTRTVTQLALGMRPEDQTHSGFSPPELVARNLMALLILGLLAVYHWRVLREDARAAPVTGHAATLRRLFVLGFSLAGLWMSMLALINILRWVLLQFGEPAMAGGNQAAVTAEVARALVGLPVWLVFWGWAQRLFSGRDEEERESALRKFYLYGAVFVAAVSAVGSATIILAGLFRRVLGLESMGDIRGPLPVAIGMAVLWAYHTRVLRDDAARMTEAPRQAGLRRLYLYLIAAVGLAAFLVGLGGDISVLIRQLSGWRPEFGEVGDSLKEALAWFTAALVAGLPVWLVPWRQAQLAAADPAKPDERRSIVRKIYLYFYLLAATLTVLSSAVYILYRLLSLALGDTSQGNLINGLAQAVAYLLMAVGVWLYHGGALRGDTALARGARGERLQALRVAVVDGGPGRLGRAVLDGLRRELPALPLVPVGLSADAAAAMGAETANGLDQLREATLIVGPWDMLRPGGLDGAATPETVQAVAGSAARKLLIPNRNGGVDWAGVDRWSDEALVRQTVQAVKQVSEGESVQPSRPLGVGTVVGIVIAALIGLQVLIGVVAAIVGG